MFIVIKTKIRTFIFGKLKGYDKEVVLISLLTTLIKRGMTKDSVLRCFEVADNEVRDRRDRCEIYN